MSSPPPEAKDAPRETGEIIYPKNSPERRADLKEPSTGKPWVMVIALALAAAGVWVFVQRRQGGGALVNRGPRKLQIDETRPLGNRQYLVVADYQGKKFLIGVTPGQIQMLTPLERAASEEKKS